MVGRSSSSAGGVSCKLRGLWRLPAFVAGCLSCLLLTAVVITALTASSASAGESVFPGRNGKILIIKRCIYGPDGGPAQAGCNRFMEMNADGSGVRSLRPMGKWYGHRWSPDGKRLVVATGIMGSMPSSISLINAQGGKASTVYGRALERRLDMSVGDPDWLPNGKRIAFLGHKGARTGIYTIALTGKGMRKVRVFSDQPEPLIHTLRASPDGRRFVFVRSHGFGASSVYVVNADGSGLKQIAKVCLGSLEWAPSGKRLLASWWDVDQLGQCVGPDSGIYLFSPAGGPKTRIFTEKQVQTGPGSGYGVRAPLATFSPDGTRIAFVVQRLDGNSAFWDTVMVMKADGSGVRQVLQAKPHIDQDCAPCVGYSQPAWKPIPRGR